MKTKESPDEGWDSKSALRVVHKQSGKKLSMRQLQTWDRSGLLSANLHGKKRKRIYTFPEIRRLCIIASLLKARVSPQRLKTSLKNIDQAAERVGKPWDTLKIVTDGESVFVVDGVKALDAIRGQVVSLILLGDLTRSTQSACDKIPANTSRDATG